LLDVCRRKELLLEGIEKDTVTLICKIQQRVKKAFELFWFFDVLDVTKIVKSLLIMWIYNKN
jgi:hypothetical protein